MWRRFKEWVHRPDPLSVIIERKHELIRGELEAHHERVRTLMEGMKMPNSIESIRHALGSIDFSDVKEDKEVSEIERKEYCASISGIYPRLEKDIKKFLHAQLLFASNQAQTWEHVLFGRGTFNGMDVLLEYWKKAHDEHLTNSRPEDPFDINAPIGEING